MYRSQIESMNAIRRFVVLACACVATQLFATGFAASPMSVPVVARIEMKLANGDKIIDVIEQGDLLTVLEEREDDYVIITHDGTKGAVDKVNAVQIAESGDIYTDLIQRNPLEGRYYTLRAGSWWALGNIEKALEDFDRAIELGYEEAHAFTSRGLFHAAMGSHDKALEDYDKAIELDPTDVAPLINRAAVFMSKNDPASAAADYTTALELEPQRSSLQRQRAIAWKAAGQPEMAIKDYDAILEKQPEDVAAIMGRGYIHFQRGRHTEAVEDFARAIELNPKDPVAFNNRGYNRFKLGKLVGALQDYDRAIELAPKYPLALQNRAWLLATADDEALRDPAEAIKSAKAACELSDYESVADLSALAAALAADGQFEDAVGWQEKVVQRVAQQYKDFAEKTLARYQDEKPFAKDPDQANQREREEAEAKGKAAAAAESNQTVAKKTL
tara:strand:- start:15842 stop:17176 length:1335 start_codon:yes stop_codon:yes gene_type:complete